MSVYDPLNKTLNYVGALANASEAHGILCGILCTVPSAFDDTVWLKSILGEMAIRDNLAEKSQQQLQLLKKYTEMQLESLDYEFTPLMPDDKSSLSERTQALGGWCQGFLLGFSLANTRKMDTLPRNVVEFIEDVTEFTRIAPVQSKDENNDSERAYMQLVEYIKVGVLTVYQEFSHFQKKCNKIQ